MTDEQPPAKKVVKRVVKKTVARPTAPPEAPVQLRYGRPVATTTTKPQAKVATKQAGPAPTTAKKGTRPVPAPRKPVRTRPSVDVGAKVGAAGHRVGDAASTVAHATWSGARTSGGFVADRARAVAAWRLPHINPYLAAVITGAVTGLVTVGLGVGALAIFDQVRGVSAGGGFWGGLAFIAVAVIGLSLGEKLLSGFGVSAPRLTSFLGVVLTVVAMLALFLGAADSGAAFYVVPMLGALTYAVAHWLVDLAENTPPVIE